MRLRKKPWVGEAIHDFDDFVFPKDAPAGEAQCGNWSKEFKREAPLFVELGTGKGKFLSTLAKRESDKNFIGIEAQQDVLYKAAQKVRELSLKNVRLLVFDINSIERIFAPGEVDGFYINFCDPWPKARHTKRRLTHRSFLEKYRTILKPGGKIFFKTDNRALFDFSLEEFSAMRLNVSEISYDLHIQVPSDNIETEYEQKFSRLGEKINRCVISFS